MSESASLDPGDWAAFRALAHRALDDSLDTLEGIRDGEPWTGMPGDVRAAIADDPLPLTPSHPARVYDAFKVQIAPYAVDNRHPRFFGWVHGAGTATGVLAEMLAASMNANVGGRDHAAVAVERRVIRWWCDVFGFPAAASGLLTTGTSMANLIGVLVARRNAAGAGVRTNGVAASLELTGYASTEAHGSVSRAFDVAGLGSTALRAIPVDDARRIDLDALQTTISADRIAGKQPFVIVGTAGSASTGAVDDLDALATLARDEDLWFHVDGAFGALVQLAPPSLRALVAGIERADSIAFDLHKWLHVPYDAGAVLVRDGVLHAATFADHAPYLARTERGTAAGEPWFTDYGPELSRGFRALSVWFTMKTYGLERFGALIAAQCALARELGERIAAEPDLELLAPVTLNIVCFRYAAPLAAAPLDALNGRIVVELQERGIAVPSTTRLGGKLAIRLNVMNHRTARADLDATLAAVLAVGAELLERAVP